MMTGTPKTQVSWRSLICLPSATAWTPQVGQNTTEGSDSTWRRMPVAQRSTRVTWKPSRSAIASARQQ